MAAWQDFIKRDEPPPEWPYPIKYGHETRLETDVLVLGGGIAGCHAAISARRSGARVAVLEKGAAKWSGSGGAGVDHWLAACTNPLSGVTPEEYTEVAMASSGGYDCGPLRYITCRESWDALLDCEKIGLKARDTEGEFAGADFRDPETGLLFAYDYKNKSALRVFGHNMKPLLYREMKRLGIEIYDRTSVTGLLSEDGKPGARVVGATAVNVRTGEFYVIKAGATIISTGLPGRIWTFSTELRSTFRDFNNTGDGSAAAWKAGAAFTKMESSYGDSGAFGYISYAMGNAHNTWYGCPIVDANGKEVPWFDRDGTRLETAAERFQPAPGQKVIIGLGERVPSNYVNQVSGLAADLAELIRKGEYKLPLYADLTRLPEQERRAIFGLMVGNEGKTRVAVYDTLTKAGFDPDKDMLQAPIMPPEAFRSPNFWAGVDVPQWRIFGSGGLVVDWDLKTSLDGLYAAGGAIFGTGAHSSAAASGRYAGRKAAAAAKAGPERPLPEPQVEAEKARVYAPLWQHRHKIGWKELNAGICRIMQDYCGEYRSEETLNAGIRLLGELRCSEAARAYASNPHELGRVLECESIMTVGEMALQASLARKASSSVLNLQRLDYPEVDPPAWAKNIVLKKAGDGVEAGELPLDYHLAAPFKPSYAENYRLHSGLTPENDKAKP